MATGDVPLGGRAMKDMRQRRLMAARLFGANLLALLGQAVIHMPEGYFGPAGQVTFFGFVYAAFLLIATGAVVAGALTGRTWARLVGVVTLALNLGLFVPALATDPGSAGALVVWFVILLSGLLFAAPADPAWGDAPPAGLAAWLVAWGPTARHLAMLAALAAIWALGFNHHGDLFVAGVCWTLQLAAVIAALPLWRHAWHQRRGTLLLALIPLLGAAASAPWPWLALVMMGLHQVAVLVVIGAQGQAFREVVDFFFQRPAVLAVSSFAVTIALGTLLLSFPVAAADMHAISPLDALFTATSATCVTGLIVVDTPTVFSTFGHGVILGLIQVGGLGIMVLSSFATLLLGGRLGLRGERALVKMLDSGGVQEAYRLSIFVVASTLAIEAVGAGLLTVCYLGHDFGLGQAVWRGAFHAVSAFCNAGFSLQSDSLAMFQQDPLALMVVAVLIVLGGLGFLVMAGAFSWLRSGRAPVLKTHIKVVLWMTAALVLSGFGLYAAVEWDASLAGLGAGDKLCNALFQSVTLRTAGFNSVPMSGLHPGSSLFMMVFMFIGACPGGTGGGIKTTTLFVLLAGVSTIGGHRSRVVVDNRQIPDRLMMRSGVLVSVYLGALIVGLFLLVLTQVGSFEALAFEAFSALGTVGLSLGVTGQLDPVGKFVIIAMMFVGRLGPLTVALLLSGRQERRVEYPAARFLIG